MFKFLRSRRRWLILLIAGWTCGVVLVDTPSIRAVANDDRFSGGRVNRDSADFAESFAPLLEVLSGASESFELSGSIAGPVDGRRQNLELRFAKWGDQAFELELNHSEYAVGIYRHGDFTALALPKHRVVFLGKGELIGPDHLQLRGITERLISRGSIVSTFAPMVFCGDPQALAGALKTLLELAPSDEPLSWVGRDGTELRVQKNVSTITETSYEVLHREWHGSMQVAVPKAPRTEVQLREELWADWRLEDLNRDELERTLSRGLRRALEVLLPSPVLTNPRQTEAQVENGELRWVDGQRLVLLSGTPEQVGFAHGQLLKSQSMACIDSVLHAFGTVQTIQTGRWFRRDLEAAYARLRPHIPEDHLIETRALANSLEISAETMEVLNVFPELFHCSGFAVFGDATLDGKLYHGRVLDYMTMIGLQDAATTFVIAVDGKIPFVTVGYAGFIGSVSGMNHEQVSLGEMGGRGEGQWDGVPMATLMRRGLEECHTLQDVIDLWSNNPRTCEYYYVFADGKDRSAVGVAATPEKIEFVYPGQGHPLLGEGIKDTVLLSAGDRLTMLRARVQESYGKIDKQKAQWLMSRPVAMSSNLHNVLFVPEDGLLQVANASHQGPAADQPYVEYNLRALVQELQTKTQPVRTK
ncbi:MAG: peptidase C45 acyl-coenzyme A:6-aminopenicillanic acid acyl-transferase [Planctomycetaceae bacterium]|nr:peptidase C45 acyl-coenzyme A:6-aminopenicillanic acid acyl-transferase [Planctomycetaceae bacterium]